MTTVIAGDNNTNLKKKKKERKIQGLVFPVLLFRDRRLAKGLSISLSLY